LKANLDRSLWTSYRLICGVDESGRGALAGPVYAAAVVLPAGLDLDGIDDSKLLSPARRRSLARDIHSRARAWAVAFCAPRTIDRINILQAALRAMHRAVRKLGLRPDLVIFDGKHAPPVGLEHRCIVGADRRSQAVACASILAKTSRDRTMVLLDRRHPGYGFARHKGYPTGEHLSALRRLGPCPEHRLTFGPVRELAQA
jgi:ribonuclease HII